MYQFEILQINLLFYLLEWWKYLQVFDEGIMWKLEEFFSDTTL